MKEHCGMIQPEKVVLGTKWIWRYKRNRRPQLVKVNVTCFRIPFSNSLEQLLNNNEVLSYVKRDAHEVDNITIITDFVHGDYIKNHPVLSRYTCCLKPFLYIDEIQLANSLGSKTKRNKLCMIYWCLGNLPPHLRSTLKAVNLLAVVQNSHVLEYGLSKVLSEFIDCINQLQSEAGLTLIIGTLPVVLHGALIFVCADTPAANSIGGFKESVGRAHRPCRGCMVTQTDIQTEHSLNDIVCRNKQMHQLHCRQIELPTISKREKKYWSRLYGVNSSSTLSAITNFDVTEQITFDFMHLILEGTLLLELKHFIIYCLDQNFFSLDVLNTGIKSFQYPKMYMSDKPSSVESQHLQHGHTLRQYAIQILCLVRCLPFIVYDYVPHDNLHLQNLILMSKIINFSLAYFIQKDKIIDLSTMITLHSYGFAHCYPDVPFTPKSHFMHHLPQNIHRFGLLRHQWCMRFEASHQWYKEISRVSKNHKNLPFTLCNRQQMNRCMQLGYGNPFSTFLSNNELVISHGQLTQVSNIEYSQEIALALECNIENFVFSVKQITLNSIQYSNNDILLTSCHIDEVPTFGMIKTIYVQENKVVVVLQDYETNNYEEALNSYNVNETRNMSVHLVSSMNSFHTLPLFKINGRDYIMLVDHTWVEMNP
jgi:hypothetical protein